MNAIAYSDLLKIPRINFTDIFDCGKLWREAKEFRSLRDDFRNLRRVGAGWELTDLCREAEEYCNEALLDGGSAVRASQKLCHVIQNIQLRLKWFMRGNRN